MALNRPGGPAMSVTDRGERMTTAGQDGSLPRGPGTGGLSRRTLAGLLTATAALAASGASAQPVTPQAPAAAPSPPPRGSPPDTPEQLALSHDAATRLTIPVMVDGHGPFAFVIDTGADRTVISTELATTLGLPKGPKVRLHESAGVDVVETVVIDRLDIGERTIRRIEAPTLAVAGLGAAGMLGIDSLHDQRVVMDFKNRTLSSVASRGEARDPDAIIVRGVSRFGQLVLVDANVRGTAVYVILDSGAQSTIGNLALQRLLTDSRAQADPNRSTQVISVTGRRSPAEFADINEMHIGGLTIRNMPLAFAELHTFERFGIADQPAMLLGMDVLSLCTRVTIDFRRREATFTLS